MPPITASAWISTPPGRCLVATRWLAGKRLPSAWPAKPWGRHSSNSTPLGKSLDTVRLQATTRHLRIPEKTLDPPMRPGPAFEKPWAGRGTGVC